ncbi:sugar transferase [Candidatus Curtissbacteria bacterium]|nr:sugar transferase [Candidatus Curtissbacteria bacterium]
MFYDFAKRTIDIVGSLVGMSILCLIFPVIAIAIKRSSPGPVFADVPKRSGKDGKSFKMYKFRSMIKDAHLLLQSDPKFKKLYEEYKKNSYKLSHDPRVTPLGHFIRKTSIDELPQFINVLKGEMSLVGPRAYYPDELINQQKAFPETKKYVKTLLTAKPGLTGPWQVSGRSDISFEKRVKLDADYAKKRSILYDLKIIILTVPALLSQKGAV